MRLKWVNLYPSTTKVPHFKIEILFKVKLKLNHFITKPVESIARFALKIIKLNWLNNLCHWNGFPWYIWKLLSKNICKRAPRQENNFLNEKSIPANLAHLVNIGHKLNIEWTLHLKCVWNFNVSNNAIYFR